MSLTYALVDTDGQLHIRTRDGWVIELINAEVGPEGHARVRLDPATELAGWVNDCGHLAPEKYPRNLVGSCLLAAYGAGLQPYAGPVVITGWDADPYADDIEIRSLTRDRQPAIRAMHRVIRRMLGIEPGDALGVDEQWVARMRTFAEKVRTAPTPELRYVAIGDLPAGGDS